VDSSLSPSFGNGADAEPSKAAQPTRRARLLRPALVLLVGSALVAGAARGWDAMQHDHDGGHGTPAPAAALEKAMTGPFVDGDGSSVAVLDATCAGEGEAAAQGYTHFRCRLVFENGETDEAVVHLLEGDELFFKSSFDPAR
jgi:hypothetical protein